MRFVLASASPARLATLRRAGADPEVIVSGVDESAVDEADPASLVLELARRKATAVAAAIDGTALVLGCDSMLDLDGVALGKPHDPGTAADRWEQLRGRTAPLRTGHALLHVHGGEVTAAAYRQIATAVRFADVTDDEVRAYVATGEPLAVAGAFTVDGLGGWFVTGVDGDHHNVVGVSLPGLREMLAELGLGVGAVVPALA